MAKKIVWKMRSLLGNFLREGNGPGERLFRSKKKESNERKDLSVEKNINTCVVKGGNLLKVKHSE